MLLLSKVTNSVIGPLFDLLLGYQRSIREGGKTQQAKEELKKKAENEAAKRRRLLD